VGRGQSRPFMLALRGARWRRGAAQANPRTPGRCGVALPAGVGKPLSPIAKKRPSGSRASSPLSQTSSAEDQDDCLNAEAAPLACEASQIRECIRSLVSMVRRKSSGDQAVDANRLASIKTVVRLLSMSADELKALPDDQRKQVVSIRNGALSKMQQARGPPTPKRQSCCSPSSPPALPQAPRSERSPRSMPPPAFYKRKTYFGVRCEA